MKKRLSILLVILSLIFIVSCAQKPVKSVQSSLSQIGDIKKVKVTTDAANVRTGCSNDAPVAQASNKNDTFDVINKVSNWYAVKLPDNKVGFIPNDQCKPVVAEDKKANVAPEALGATPGATQGGTTPNTPDTKTNSSSLTDAEQEMLKLINTARAQNNVAPLKIDMEVTNVARIKSQDMIDNNYFSHYSPTYGSPFDMMKNFGIDYVQAGENIAGNQNVQNAHNGLMNSPGHRKNILNPDFTHIGIGIKKGSNYGNIFTQMFVSKPK